MPYFSHQRLNDIFNHLQERTLPQEALSELLDVSTRTVRSDINTLNDILADQGAEFIHLRGKGYQLQITHADKYQQFLTQGTRHSVTPRTAQERIKCLLILFLINHDYIKLNEIADNWFISRGALQNDLLEIRAIIEKYHLTIESKAKHGMSLFGKEESVRACLGNALFSECEGGGFKNEFIEHNIAHLSTLQIFDTVKTLCNHHKIKTGLEGEKYISIYCLAAVIRHQAGYTLQKKSEPTASMLHTAAYITAQDIATKIGLNTAAEIDYLCIQIASRCKDHDSVNFAPEHDEHLQLVSYLLNYINQYYNYDLRHDTQLEHDLIVHTTSMITRLQHHIDIQNPLRDHIKQYYPLAYDITLSALSAWEKQTTYRISEDEIGYIVIHIGVGLVRHYNIGYEHYPTALLVCDSGKSTTRMLQTIIKRKFPELVIKRLESLSDYQCLPCIEEDFVISAMPLPAKDKPVVQLTLFPSDYQLEEIGHLMQKDRIKPYVLERFFHEQHFCVLQQETTKDQLFMQLCKQLETEGYVNSDFYPSLVERENILSTMLGEGIALPHSLGLLANKTTVFTVLSPQGIEWGKGEKAHVIFLLAINKSEYEEAMALYELFVTLMNDKKTKALLTAHSFAQFKLIAQSNLH
ncbi:BglG family transcription antiterminator [Plesiomonas sp.]|uniref:BglG family transcription antiterminator n=1 Tax=Plesiomonas sp. TaxID=2486279 RepID=UPI003F377281